MGQLKPRAYFEVALETGVGRFARIDNVSTAAASFHVQTAGTVARLASHVLGVLPLGLQPCMRCRAKFLRDFAVTRIASFRPDELRAGDTGWRENRAIRCAGK